MKDLVLERGDTVLVTGGAGYVGSHLVPMLLERGYRVRILETFLYGEAGMAAFAGDPRVELLRGDICNVRDLIQSMKGVKSVIALAALVGDGACELDHDEAVAINVESTKLLCHVAKLSPTVERLVFASSCSVYGATEGLVLNEGSKLNPVSFYARSRIVSEHILARELADHSVVVLRLGTVFGAAARMRLDLMINTMTHRAVTTGRITVTGGGAWRPHVHVRDVANAFLLAAEAPHATVSGEIFNVGADRNNFTISDTAKLVAKVIAGTEIQHSESIEDPRSYRVSFAKIHHVLGFEPVYGIEDGVREVRDMLASGTIDADASIYSNLRHLREHGFGRGLVPAAGSAKTATPAPKSATR
jgi:nucleoside-diphosphate-sugar epimerase